jgi:hypothetical protein
LSPNRRNRSEISQRAALRPSDAITTNDANWSAITPNPWRGAPSIDSDNCEIWSRELGMTVMQIDTRPGLARQEGVRHVGFDVDGNPYCDE